MPKNQHTQRKLLNFANWWSGELSKIGHHFRKYGDLKIYVKSRNVNNKKCAVELVIFNLKKDFKIPMILAFFDTSPIHQFPNFNNFLWVCWFLAKNLSNSESLSLKNSTTSIAIMSIVHIIDLELSTWPTNKDQTSVCIGWKKAFFSIYYYHDDSVLAFCMA